MITKSFRILHHLTRQFPSCLRPLSVWEAERVGTTETAETLSEILSSIKMLKRRYTMAFVDTYRSNVARKMGELMRLREDRSKEIKKNGDVVTKIQRASDAIRRTTSQSGVKTRLDEISRLEKQRADLSKKISDIETKIARKEKELVSEQSKLSKEEAKIVKKRMDDALKLEKERDKQFSNIDGALKEQQSMYKDVSNRIDEMTSLPEKIKVLFLAISPRDQQPLSLDEEARAITDMIRKSKHRDSVEFVSCWAVRPFDVLQAINEHEPAIIHFSGHGSIEFIAFQDDYGKTKPVSKDALVQTMMASSSNIRLVFLNTCYSSTQAESIVRYVEATIGMNNSIGDEAARVFASQFYSAIGFGLSVETAFQQAKALLMLEGINEENTPELFVAQGIDSNELIIVSP